MILNERQFLESEITALEELISQTPEEDVIDRNSLEARKRKVEGQLSALSTTFNESVRTRLIFRGKPTFKNRGIFTDFAGIALDKFTSMVAAIGASQTNDLGLRGIIPKKEDYQLMITGTTKGSFGFEIEEVQPKLSSEISPVKAAINKVNLIMELSPGASDDDLAEIIADESQRAIIAIRAFLDVMEDNEAQFALVLDSDIDDHAQFVGVEQIKRIKERLKPENIREGETELLGKFQGTISTRRLFEFLIENPPEIIVGKVGPEIEDPIKINQILEKPTRIQVHTKQVGKSRPTYRLISVEDLKKTPPI